MLLLILVLEVGWCLSPHLKVGTSSIIAPIPLAAPSQRLILGPADLSRLGIHIALKLWRGAAEQTLVDGLLAAGRGRGGVSGRGGRGGGDVSRNRGGFGGWLKGRGDFGGALEALEFGLLLGGEFGRRGAGLEG